MCPVKADSCNSFAYECQFKTQSSMQAWVSWKQAQEEAARAKRADKHRKFVQKTPKVFRYCHWRPTTTEWKLSVASRTRKTSSGTMLDNESRASDEQEQIANARSQKDQKQRLGTFRVSLNLF